MKNEKGKEEKNVKLDEKIAFLQENQKQECIKELMEKIETIQKQVSSIEETMKQMRGE